MVLLGCSTGVELLAGQARVRRGRSSIVSPLYRLSVVSREGEARSAGKWVMDAVALLFLLAMVGIFWMHR